MDRAVKIRLLIRAFQVGLSGVALGLLALKLLYGSFNNDDLIAVVVALLVFNGASALILRKLRENSGGTIPN